MFKNKKDKLDLCIISTSSLMFVISAILTVSLYLEDSKNITSYVIFGGMGFCVELAKVISIILLGFFILKKTNISIFFTAILSVALTLVSVYANFAYTNNSDINKQESSKKVTKEYKILEKQIVFYKNELKEFNSEKKTKNKEALNFSKKISELTEERNKESNEYFDIWSKEQVSTQYNNSIELLYKSKNKLELDLLNLNKSIEINKNKQEKIRKKMLKTKKYEFIKSQGINSKIMRIFLGILFEIVAVGMFFLSIKRKIILKEEENGIEKPQEILEKSINKIAINVTKNYSNMISNALLGLEKPTLPSEKKSDICMSKELSKNNNLLGLEKPTLPGKNNPAECMDTGLSKNNALLGSEKPTLPSEKIITIENIKKFHLYLTENSNNQIAVGYKKVANGLGITQGEALRIYRKLKEKKYISVKNNKTYLNTKKFKEEDFS